jgi:predicted nucleic acid-binding protein
MAGIAAGDSDLLLAAQARQEGAVLVTRDRDFKYLEVVYESWPDPPSEA